MQSESPISQALLALIKSGNANNQGLLSVPAFNQIDIYPIFRHLFNEKAIQALDNKTKELVHQYIYVCPNWLIMLGKLNLSSCKMYKDFAFDELIMRRIDLVHFAVVRTGKENLDKALNKIIGAVNHVADMGYTRAALVPLAIMELTTIDRPEPDYAIMSYLTLSDKGSKYVEQHMKDVFVKEGDITPRIE
jgi:hypothetical protein